MLADAQSPSRRTRQGFEKSPLFCAGSSRIQSTCGPSQLSVLSSPSSPSSLRVTGDVTGAALTERADQGGRQDQVVRMDRLLAFRPWRSGLPKLAKVDAGDIFRLVSGFLTVLVDSLGIGYACSVLYYAANLDINLHPWEAGLGRVDRRRPSGTRIRCCSVCDPQCSTGVLAAEGGGRISGRWRIGGTYDDMPRDPNSKPITEWCRILIRPRGQSTAGGFPGPLFSRARPRLQQR